MNIAWHIARDVVRKQASWRPVLLLRATLLVKRALNQYIEGLAIGRDSKALEVLVVIAAGISVSGMGTAAGLYSGGELALKLSVLFRRGK